MYSRIMHMLTLKRDASDVTATNEEMEPKRARSNTPLRTDSAISLETLPTEVLDVIFQYVPFPDLARICRLSQDLHLPAMRRLYHSITITHDEAYTWAAKHLDYWLANDGAVVSISSIRDLVKTLKKNKKNANLVRKLVVCELDAGPHAHDIMLLLNCLPSLEIYHDNSSIGFSADSPALLESVSTDINNALSLKSNTLVELEINDVVISPLGMAPSLLARNLHASGGYQTLRKLHFTSRIPSDIATNPFTPHDPVERFPMWILFFLEFENLGVQLDLTSLGLNGTLGEPHAHIIDLLNKTVNMRELRELVLNHFEGVHSKCSEGFNPSDRHITFLEWITKHTPKLSSLALYPTSDNPMCQSQAIWNTLKENIPHQLTDLFISFPSSKTSYLDDRMSHQSAIAQSQKNLVRLRLEDGFNLFAAQYGSESVVRSLGDFMNGIWNSEILRQRIYPRVFQNLHLRPAFVPGYSEYVSETDSAIQESLEAEPADVYAHWDKKTLSQLFLGGVFFDMQNYGVYTNDGVVPLKKPDFIW